MKIPLYFLILIGFTSTLISSQVFATKKAASSTPSTVQTISIAYLTQKKVQPTEMLSNLDPFISEKGSTGAQLAIAGRKKMGTYL